jgi:hypothetical protein
MFREYVDLVNESVDEGVNRGIQMFLENLNQDLVSDEIYEEFGGIEESLKQIFVENGFEVSPDLAATNPETLEESDDEFDAKLDNILEQLKKEGIVD